MTEILKMEIEVSRNKAFPNLYDIHVIGCRDKLHKARCEYHGQTRDWANRHVQHIISDVDHWNLHRRHEAYPGEPEFQISTEIINRLKEE